MAIREFDLSRYPIQDAFVFCSDRFTAFIAGIRAGKTFAGTVKAIMQATKRGGLGMVVSPTYPMARDIAVRMFRDLAGEALIDFNKTEMRAVMANGAEVLFRSADNPENLRGLGLTWAWIDEAALCPKETWDIVIGRLSEGGSAGPCWITTTPKGRNWVYERSTAMTVFRAKTEDNPYLDPEFVASLRAAYVGKFAQQELDAEFVGFEGLVYEEFDRGIHVHERPKREFTTFIAGVDEGYTNPAVILVIGLDNDDRAHVVYEFYRRRVLQDAFVDEAVRLMREYNISGFYVDPSAAGLIAAMTDVGLPVYMANNAVRQGIQEVKSRLTAQRDRKPRLTLSPSAVNTAAEFESYCWKESKQGLRDEPEKANDHAMDALRYALLSVSTRPQLVAAINPFYG